MRSSEPVKPGELDSAKLTRRVIPIQTAHERRREEGQGVQGGVDEHAGQQGGRAQADDAEGQAQREREREPVDIDVPRRIEVHRRVAVRPPFMTRPWGERRLSEGPHNKEMQLTERGLLAGAPAVGDRCRPAIFTESRSAADLRCSAPKDA